MHQFLRKVGALRFALTYIAVAAALSILLDWTSLSFDNKPDSPHDAWHYLDQFILLSITGVALFFLTSAFLTERRQEQEKHRQTQRAYQQLFRAHTQPMWLINEESRQILDVNDAAIAKYGWSKEEFLTLRADDLQYPPAPSQEALDEHFASFLDSSGHNTTGKRHRNREGHPFWVELTTHPVHFDDADMLLVTGVDISVQVEAARAARKALKHLEDAEKLGRFGSWEWHPGSSTMEASRGLAHLLGVPYEDRRMPIQVAIDRVHPEDRHLSKAAAEKCLEVGDSETRFRGMLENGDIRYYREIFHRQVYNAHEVVITGSVIDETDQILHMQRLERQESDLRTMLISLPAPVVLHEPGENGKLYLANPAFYCMLGVPAGEESSIANLSQLGAGQEQKNFLRHLLSSECGQPSQTPKQEILLKRVNGSVFRAHIHCTRLNLTDQNMVQLVIHDMDDEIVLREQLRQANQNLSKLNSKTIKVLEQERALISRELHDDIGQLLIAVKTNTRSLFNKWPPGEPKPDEAGLISDILEEVIAKVRDRSLMLRPPQLDELGLKHAISWEMRRVLSATSIQAQLHDRVQCDKLPPEPTLTAFRIFQESMTNAVRHGEPERLDVIMEADDRYLRVAIEDDGKGFDPEEQQNGLGLANMRERASLVAGVVAITSAPGQGTRVEAKLPLNGG